MRRSFQATLASLAILAACATPEPEIEVNPPPSVPVPFASAQRPEELGKLEAGRVVSVGVEQFRDTYSWGGEKTMVVIPFPGAHIPVELSSSRHSRRVIQQYFRYVVRRKDQAELAYWDEFVAYPVGSCIARREEPYSLVPALAAACD